MMVVGIPVRFRALRPNITTHRGPNKNRVPYSNIRPVLGPAKHLCRPKKVQVTGQTICRRIGDHPGLVVKVVVRSGPFMAGPAFNSCISALPRPLENTCGRLRGVRVSTRYAAAVEGA